MLSSLHCPSFGHGGCSSFSCGGCGGHLVVGVIMWWSTVIMWCLFGHGCGGNETVIFPFTKTPLTLNFKLLSATHRAPSTRRLINNTRHHPPAIHISPLPSSTSQKASMAIPGRCGGAIVPQTSLSVNARVTPTLSGILQNAVIVS